MKNVRIPRADLERLIKSHRYIKSHQDRDALCTLYQLKAGAGMYDKINHLVDNIEIRNAAFKAVSYVVGISSYGQGPGSLKSSGIIIEHNGTKMILTCAYILGDDFSLPIEVDILLPNRENVKGYVSHVDQHHNIVLIAGEFTGMTTAVLADTFPQINDVAIAIERSSSGLFATSGRVNIRRDDHFESDDLFSSSCPIFEDCIGGPLVDNSGLVLGVNFFSRKFSTPFMPSTILLKCVENLLHYHHYGVPVSPWIGLKLRSPNDENPLDLESFFVKFNSTDGLIVKEVIKGSPADEAGIKINDVIISCNDTPLSSPAEFTWILFQMVKLPIHPPQRNFESAESIEVVIHSATTGAKETKTVVGFSYIPPVINRWPVLPPVSSTAHFYPTMLPIT